MVTVKRLRSVSVASSASNQQLVNTSNIRNHVVKPLECQVNSDLAANGRALDREHHKRKETVHQAMLHLKETFQT